MGGEWGCVVQLQESTENDHHVRRKIDDPIEAVLDIATAKIVAGVIQVYATKNSVGNAAQLIIF